MAGLRARVDEALAERTLVEALDAGDSRATRPLMRLYRVSGRLGEIVGLVPRLPDDPAGLFSKSVYAERRLGDGLEAIRLAELSAELGRGAMRERAMRRTARLRARIAALTASVTK
jgi:hypothetical protein